MQEIENNPVITDADFDVFFAVQRDAGGAQGRAVRVAGRVSQSGDDVDDAGAAVLPGGRNPAARRGVAEVRLGVEDQENGLGVVVGVAALAVFVYAVPALSA